MVRGRRQLHRANLPRTIQTFPAYFLARNCLGLALIFFFFFPSPVCVETSLPNLWLRVPLYHPLSQSTYTFWLQQNTLRLCLKTGRDWQCQHLNVLRSDAVVLPFVLCLSARHPTFLGPRSNYPGRGKKWLLHFLRRDDRGFGYWLERMVALLLHPRFVLDLNRYPYTHIHSSILHNRQRMETTQVSING